MRHYMTAHSTRLQQIPSRSDSLADSLLQYFPAEGTASLRLWSHLYIDPNCMRSDGETPKTGNTPIAKERILLDKVQSLLDSVQSKHHENLARLKRLDELLTQLSTVCCLYMDLSFQELTVGCVFIYRPMNVSIKRSNIVHSLSHPSVTV